jgi:GT2 family glycosyltransferase
MTPVLILTHNNLDLTKRCVESVLAQDVPAEPFLFDNGSSDGTPAWIIANKFEGWIYPENKGVSYGWNVGLNYLFANISNSVLVVNNDTILPPYFLEELAASAMLNRNEFITGTSVNTMEAIQGRCPEYKLPVPHPDFSAFLISKSAWEKVGLFDESMQLYASDCDYHARGHLAGVKMMKANVPFYHERSSTLNKANPEEKAKIHARANADRQAFRDKWNCIPGEPAYADLFKPELFGKGL